MVAGEAGGPEEMEMLCGVAVSIFLDKVARDATITLFTIEGAWKLSQPMRALSYFNALCRSIKTQVGCPRYPSPGSGK